MFDSYFEPLPNLQAYLQRIGMENEPVELSKAYVDKLIVAHLDRIPFENLDVWDGHKTPSLRTPDLFDKLVLHKRGGYCFEQNGLLYAVLTALGFECYTTGMRILRATSTDIPTIAHRSVICIIDGKKHLCDVGYGGMAICEAVPFDAPATDNGYHFEFEGDYTFFCKDCEGEHKRVFMFIDTPLTTKDFEIYNYFISEPEKAGMKRMPMITRVVNGGRIQYVGGKLSTTDINSKNVQLIREISDKKELQQVLEEMFGIEYHFES